MLAIALIGYGGMSVYRQHHMVDTYETTNGTVVATSIHSEQDTKPSLFGDSKSYYPTVKYSYSVGGTSYSNDNIYSSAKRPGGSGGQSKAARFLSKYPKGKRVVIHYSENDPSKSFLSSRYTFFPAYFALLIGLLLFRDSLNPGTSWIRTLLYRHGSSRGKSNEGSMLADPPSLDSEDWDDDDDWPQRESASTTDAPGSVPVTDGRRLLLLSAGFYLAAAAVLGHYFLVSSQPYGYVAYASALVLAAGVVIEMKVKHL
ncbi:hypothetical protein A4G99_11310 [Haladaptatus sp. R4]|nr:hypothetical protein A4G99_11310 [Haladaptatus sp. R4]